MSFYNNYIKLCKYAGISPSKAASEAGLSKSAVSKWKNNQDAEPSYDTLKLISNYFNISIDDLTLDDDQGSELGYYCDLLKAKPELRLLLSVSSNASKEQIRLAAKILGEIYEMQKL